MPDCPACRQPVIRAYVNGRPLLFDPQPSPAGIYAVLRASNGGHTAREAAPGETVPFPERRLIEHRWVCPDAEPPPSLTEPRVEASYKERAQAAVSQQRAAKRRGRWRRKPPPVTGVRINPAKGTQ